MSIVFVTGGVRSGKSAFAEQLAKEKDVSVLYVATGVATDKEMEQRIALHRERRPASWEVAEHPYEADAFVSEYSGYEVVLFDCVSTWLSNLLLTFPEGRWRDGAATEEIKGKIERWLSGVRQYQGTMIVVSSEAGLGGVAMSRLGRWFQDMLGWANQRIAAEADEVYAVISGIPCKIKGERI
ncbi:bifunctional adenosylcobinamide kinase/adenosylcobinamide-phosphate guanylyltransferase [Aneurinibacillus thermoaerophilus]|uniref:bifunctional adenosylcobinamide kinase/adenosylcobinamide-phosphate guanylyltransferase n=1 Tax=Aneurinibacillus thermoaerophilus TaxID=143495 RepID=UPI002E9C1F6D|nr:bifunctional adenosylcobinamide kinase/adenosylcobinamide-phosphate guanylyltransferase [Aneurinibacillus thermoaerophilus]